MPIHVAASSIFISGVLEVEVLLPSSSKKRDRSRMQWTTKHRAGFKRLKAQGLVAGSADHLTNGDAHAKAKQRSLQFVHQGDIDAR